MSDSNRTILYLHRIGIKTDSMLQLSQLGLLKILPISAKTRESLIDHIKKTFPEFHPSNSQRYLYALAMLCAEQEATLDNLLRPRTSNDPADLEAANQPLPPLIDMFKPITDEQATEINRFLAGLLTPDEFVTLYLYYCEEKMMKEIAGELGYTGRVIKHLRRNGLQKVKAEFWRSTLEQSPPQSLWTLETFFKQNPKHSRIKSRIEY